MKKLCLILTFLLAACSSNDRGAIGVPPVGGPSPSPITQPGTAPWVITAASIGIQGQHLAAGNYFDFPVCASASACHISYVEIPWGSIYGKSSVTLNYSITGDNPVFNNQSPGNTCGGPAALSLFIHQAGDNMSALGVYQYYRQFSQERQALELGQHSFTVSLQYDKWTPVYPPPQANGFTVATQNVGSLGFVLGGGCFSGHGVALTSGTARFTVGGLLVQ